MFYAVPYSWAGIAWSDVRLHSDTLAGAVLEARELLRLDSEYKRVVVHNAESGLAVWDSDYPGTYVAYRG